MKPRLLLCLSMSTAACSDLQTFAVDGTCGNKILEPGEDCDTFGIGDGTACGGAGTTRACRLIHGPGETPRCPDGWGAGLDGICRAPSGLFSDPQILGVSGGNLQLGDLNGDGRSDLVLASGTTIEIAYGDVEGRFESTVEITAEAPSAEDFVGDVDGDGLDDIVRSLTAGSLVIQGTRSRAPVPLTVPVRARPGRSVSFRGVEVVTQPNQPGTMVLGVLAVPRDNDDPEGSRVDFRFELLGVPQVDLEASAIESLLQDQPAGRSLAFALPAADLDPSPDGRRTETEVALLFAGALQIPIIRVRCADQAPPGEPLDCSIEVVAELGPPGGGGDPMRPSIAPEGGQFLDYDGDGDLDLVVGEELAMMGRRARVFLGEPSNDPDRVIFAPPFTDQNPSNPVNCTTCEPGTTRLLEIRDVDGDGDLDYLTARGLYVTTASGAASSLVARAPTPWSGARLVDLNGDGRLDVVGRRPDGLDAFLSAAGGFYNDFTLEVSGSPNDFEVGDFNGDGRTDVAVLEDDTRVTVLFSDGAVPAERIVMASAEGIEDLQAFRLGGLDAKDDLLFSSEVEPEEDVYTRQFGVLEGNSSGRLVGSLLPNVRAQSYAAGPLLGPERGHQLLVGRWGGPDEPFEFYLVEGETLVDRQPITPGDVEASLECEIPSQSGLTLRRAPGRAALYGVKDRGGGIDIETSVLYRIEFPADGGPAQCAESPTGRALPAATSVALADVDGNGTADMLAGFPFAQVRGMPMGMGMTPEDAESPATLVVWPDVEQGGLPTATHYELEAFSGRFVTLSADIDEADDLVVLVDDTLLLLDGPSELATLGALEDEEESEPFLAELPRGADEIQSLRAIDADGDGLDDIVFSTGSETFLLRQLPCSPGRAADGDCARERSAP